MLGILLLALASYLVGAIPFGYLLVRMLRGIDVRTIGSKNLGATNVARALGARWFAVVFLLDFLKGIGPALLFAGIAERSFGAPPSIGLLYGLLAIAGHVWPVYLNFRGGKGVATASGVVFGVAPAAAAVAFAVFAAVFLAFRYVSLASICAAACLPAAWLVVGGPADLTFAALALTGVLVVWKHRTNFRRLVAGTEPRVGGRRGEDGR